MICKQLRTKQLVVDLMIASSKQITNEVTINEGKLPVICCTPRQQYILFPASSLPPKKCEVQNDEAENLAQITKKSIQ